MHPRNTHEKKFWIQEMQKKKNIWTHEIPTRKKIKSTKYPKEKNLELKNTHENKYWTNEIPTKKIFGPKIYSRGNVLDPRRHDGVRLMRPSIKRDP